MNPLLAIKFFVRILIHKWNKKQPATKWCFKTNNVSERKIKYGSTAEFSKDPGFGDLLTFLVFFLNSRVLQYSEVTKIILLVVDPDGKAEWELTQH